MVVCCRNVVSVTFQAVKYVEISLLCKVCYNVSWMTVTVTLMLENLSSVSDTCSYPVMLCSLYICKQYETCYQWVGPEAVSEHHPLSKSVVFIVIFCERGWTIDSKPCSVHSGGSPRVKQTLKVISLLSICLVI